MSKLQKTKSPTIDPHAEREALKYSKPIASREYILSILQDVAKPMTYEDLLVKLAYHETEDMEALRRRLKAMERDGQLIRNRKHAYLPVNQTELVRGRVIGHADGFGFLVPDDGSEDIFLGPRAMRSLLHGDKAIVRIGGIDNKGRREGILIEVLERANQEVVGRLTEDGGVFFVEPDNKRLHLQILIPSKQALKKATPGQMVKVAITEQPTLYHEPIGKVVEIIGDPYAPGMEIEIAVRTYNLPDKWSSEIKAAAKHLPKTVPNEITDLRKDIRHLSLVTIDGEDARDFDDAVYCEAKPYGFRLWVAIADVSYYVTPNDVFDIEARHRGTSVYFPGKVIPMLSEELSNGLCSLNPQVDRFCMVCEMQINHEGKITRSQFYQAVMYSHARLTYNQVAAMLFEDHIELQQQYADLLPHLHDLNQLYQVLAKARQMRGCLEFDTVEPRFYFDEQGKIKEIKPLVRNNAHKIIEECMIAANVAAARFLKRHKMPALYRIHEGPDKQKLIDLRSFLKELGLPFSDKAKITSQDYANVMQVAKDRPDFHLIQTRLLRSFTQAMYSPKKNIGHFGLSLEDYAHFTSPIRRYPDLLVHRAISHILEHKQAADYIYGDQDMMLLGDECSMLERRADEATRDAIDVLKCRYMEDKVGQCYEGIITSVAPFGLFVELQDIYIEGLVHVTSLSNEFFHFDPIRHQLTGERTGRRFRLSDAVAVQVVRVSVEDRRIDLALNEENIKSKPPRNIKINKSKNKKRNKAKKPSVEK